MWNAGNLTDMTKAVFMPNGRPPAAGTVIRQPKLAATYARVAREGKESFYRGAIAKEIVASIAAQGGIIDAEDLPLNVSREILQQNRLLTTIKTASTKKILGELKKLAKADKDKYAI